MRNEKSWVTLLCQWLSLVSIYCKLAIIDLNLSPDSLIVLLY
jgi:hypothetical protein